MKKNCFGGNDMFVFEWNLKIEFQIVSPIDMKFMSQEYFFID